MMKKYLFSKSKERIKVCISPLLTRTPVVDWEYSNCLSDEKSKKRLRSCLFLGLKMQPWMGSAAMALSSVRQEANL
jgi:hypothetical protein